MVFCNYADLAARLDDPDLPVTADSVLVLQNAGPQGGPGMPEWGMLPIPKKLLQQGVRDMVRDLRCAHERHRATAPACCTSRRSRSSAGRWRCPGRRLIELDVPARRLSLRVPKTSSRNGVRVDAPRAPRYPRGYGHLFARHVTQAHEGCDFDFLHRAAETPEPEIY